MNNIYDAAARFFSIQTLDFRSFNIQNFLTFYDHEHRRGLHAISIRGFCKNVGLLLSDPLQDGMHFEKTLRCQAKLLIPSQPSTAIAIETQTNLPCTHTSQPAEPADDEIFPAIFKYYLENYISFSSHQARSKLCTPTFTVEITVNL